MAPNRSHAEATQPLAMNPLPTLDGVGALQHGAVDWPRALGNAQDAKVAAEAFRALVHDAVYLDEEAYSIAVNQTQVASMAQGYKRQVRDLEHEAAALRAELERKDEQLTAAAARHREAQKQIAELQTELENNAVVFRVHYQELLMRNEEIERLKAVIEERRPSGERQPSGA